MSWQLNTAIDTGDFDSVNYDKIRIVKLIHDSVQQTIQLQIDYGLEVGGSWVSKPAPPNKEVAFFISGSDYVSLVTHVSNDGELTYAAVKRGLYEWLFAQGHIAAGVIV